MEKEQNKNGPVITHRFLEFDLGKESYAIPLLSVREVIPTPETTVLPNGPAHMVGIMNLRGQIISVIDLRNKLKIKPRENNKEQAVLIVDMEGVSIGLVVDSINKVLSIATDELAEVPEIKSQVNATYIQGVYKGAERLTIILDIMNILNINEIKKLMAKAS